MIRITINPETGTARAATGVVMKAAGGVPVVLEFATDPGAVAQIEMALSTDSSAPQVLAYLGSFEKQNQKTYTGTLDASDVRLQTTLAEKQMSTVDCELVVTVTGKAPRVYPNFAISVQKPAISGPQTTEGGPTYPTEAPKDGKSYVRRDGAWVEVQDPDPYVPSYLLRAESFTAEAGKSYAVDTSALDSFPEVLPCAKFGGLVLTGDSQAWQGREIYAYDYGYLDYYFDEEWESYEIFFESGVTTLGDVMDYLDSSGITATLDEGASRDDLMQWGSWTLGGGAPAYDVPIPVAVTLPATPAVGDVIAFADARNTWGDNPITILRGGEKIEGAEANFSNSAAGTFFSLVYISAAMGWRVLSSGTKPINIIAPSVTGSFVFTADTGAWTGSPTSYAYQWQLSDDGAAGWTDIAGAAAAKKTMKGEEEGKYLRVLVSATNANGTSIPAASEIIGPLAMPEFPVDGLMAFWSFNDNGSGGLSLVDASGNGHTLTNNNATGLTAGKIEGGGDFTGNKWLTRASLDPNGDFTAACWVKVTSTPDYGQFITSRSSSGVVVLGLDKDDHSIVCASLVGPAQFVRTAENIYTLDQWFHAAARREGNLFSIFINGEKEAEGTISNFPASWPYAVGLGANTNGTEFLRGAMDAVGIWNRALTDEEIEILYAGGEGVEI